MNLQQPVQRIRDQSIEMLGLDKMSNAYLLLVLNYILFMLYTTLETTFVNTLLYTVIDDMSIVLAYRAILYFAMGTMTHIAAYICHKRSILFVIRIGGALYILTYAMLFFGLNHMQYIWMIVAFLAGSGNAFYWSAHMQLVPHYTTIRNRDVGMAILGIVQGGMTLFVPLISGYVITWMSGTNGYRVLFGICIVAALGQLRVQMMLVPVERKRPKSQLRLALHLIHRLRSYRFMVGYEVVRGLRDGAFAFILNMLLFEIVTDESLVGINTFLTGAASIAGAWVFGKVVHPNRRGQYAMLAAGILSALTLLMYLWLNPPFLMMFTVISSFLSLFIVNSCSNTTYDLMGQNSITRKCVGETIAIREGMIAIGRLIGLAFLMLMPHDQQGYVTSILALTLAQIACGFLMYCTQREMKKHGQKEMA